MPVLTRRGLLGQTVVAGAYLGIRKAHAQTAPPAAQPAPSTGGPLPATAGPVAPKLIEDLVAANHILVDQGVLDGYGHVSVRHDRDPARFLMSRSLAPELVTAADVLEFDLDANAVDARGANLFLERFIHSGIYRARPDVFAVVHSHSPSVIPFGVSGVALRPVYHMSAFLGAGAPVFDIRKAKGMTDMLVRTPELGKALAQALGTHSVVLMRGHGAVAVGPDLPHAVFRSVYTEINARLQGQALALARKVTYLDPEEARLAEASLDKTLSRPWELWRRKVIIR